MERVVKNMIVLDMETSGVDPQKCSIISIGALEFEHPENKFYGECRIWEGAEITEESLRITGFTRKELTITNAKSHRQLIEEFLVWIKPIKNKTIAGFSVWFDANFFKAALAREGFLWIFGHKYVDAHAIAYEHFARAGKLILKPEGTSALTLDRILEFLGIKVRGNTHNALEDAELTAEVLSRLIYGKNLLPKYK